MKINKKYEEILINIGIETLLERAVLQRISSERKKKKDRERKSNGRKWSKSQRVKFLKTMKNKWSEKKREAA